MKYLTNTLFRIFHYTKDDTEVIDVELPGVDPADVKITQENGRFYLNEARIAQGFNGNFYDLSAVKAELKHGLLTITIPRKKPNRQEIPLLT